MMTIKPILHYFPLILTLLLTTACGNRQENAMPHNDKANTLALAEEGDSTIYGLVCEGSTDTILIFLSSHDISASPDTFSILDATRNHNVFGQLKTGDDVAVVLNAKDSTVASIVIDLKDLLSTWCYQVQPTPPDSLREQLPVAREYVLQMKGDHSALVYSNFKAGRRQEEESTADYPHLKRYGLWHLYNGKLLFTETQTDTTGTIHPISTDTAHFVMMRPDTLILRFNDGLRHYYPMRE